MSPLARTASRDARRRLGMWFAGLLLALAAACPAFAAPAEHAAFVLGMGLIARFRCEIERELRAK